MAGMSWRFPRTNRQTWWKTGGEGEGKGKGPCPGEGGNACFLSALAAKRKMEEQLSDSRVDLGITK
jgi:hypothetical protein